VIAYLQAKPGKEQQLIDTLMSLVGPTRLEAGCINYHLHVSNEDPSRFMFYENWASKKDLDDHLAKPHLVPLLSRTDELLDGEVRIEFFTMISESME
jgi:quinol monooxygenase YgiN